MEDFPGHDRATRSTRAARRSMVEAAHKDFTSQCGLPEDEFYSDAFTPATPAPTP